MTPEMLAEIQHTLTLKFDGSEGYREEEKRNTILEYAQKYNCRTLVETGTNRGDTVEATRGHFDSVYSIEIGPNLYEAAQRRFAGIENVHLLVGDAREVLPALISHLPLGRVIFYLDAHCQYDDSSPLDKAQGTSVPAELQAISQLRPNSVVLIDDARLFSPAYDAPGMPKHILGTWPALAETIQKIESWGIWDIELKNDMIRLMPGS